MSSQHTAPTLQAPNRDLAAAILGDGVDIRIRLTGVSMKPFVRTGSVLTFSARVDPEVGDIVLMSFGASAQKLIAHRVQAVDTGHVWTKGDSNGFSDPKVARSRVLACATTLETRIGAIPLRNAAMRSLGRAASVLYPSLVRTYRRFFPIREELTCNG